MLLDKLKAFVLKGYSEYMTTFTYQYDYVYLPIWLRLPTNMTTFTYLKSTKNIL